MMEDLIKKADAIKAVSEPFDRKYWQYTTRSIRDTVEALKHIPSAENKGEWIIREVKFGIYKYQCKECGWYEYHAYGEVKPHNFCPNCGADMRKGADNE